MVLIFLMTKSDIGVHVWRWSPMVYNWDPEIGDVLTKMDEKQKAEYFEYTRNTKQSNPDYTTKLAKAIRILLKARGVKDETKNNLSDILT